MEPFPQGIPPDSDPIYQPSTPPPDPHEDSPPLFLPNELSRVEYHRALELAQRDPPPGIRRFLRLWFDLGIWGTLLGGTLTLIQALRGIHFWICFLLASEDEVDDWGTPPIEPLLLFHLGWREIALGIPGAGVAAYLHECGHAAAASAEGLVIHTWGVTRYLAAYVELPPLELGMLSSRRQLRILLAGVWHNYTLVLLFLFVGSRMDFAQFAKYPEEVFNVPGVWVGEIHDRELHRTLQESMAMQTSPVHHNPGFNHGIAITSVNGMPVDSVDALEAAIGSMGSELGRQRHRSFCVPEAYLLQEWASSGGFRECCNATSPPPSSATMGGAGFTPLQEYGFEAEPRELMCFRVLKVVGGEKSAFHRGTLICLDPKKLVNTFNNSYHRCTDTYSRDSVSYLIGLQLDPQEGETRSTMTFINLSLETRYGTTTIDVLDEPHSVFQSFMLTDALVPQFADLHSLGYFEMTEGEKEVTRAFFLRDFFAIAVIASFTLGMFNLLPIPHSDGLKIMAVLCQALLEHVPATGRLRRCMESWSTYHYKRNGMIRRTRPKRD